MYLWLVKKSIIKIMKKKEYYINKWTLVITTKNDLIIIINSLWLELGYTHCCVLSSSLDSLDQSFNLLPFNIWQPMLLLWSFSMPLDKCSKMQVFIWWEVVLSCLCDLSCSGMQWGFGTWLYVYLSEKIYIYICMYLKFYINCSLFICI